MTQDDSDGVIEKSSSVHFAYTDNNQRLKSHAARHDATNKPSNSTGEIEKLTFVHHTGLSNDIKQTTGLWGKTEDVFDGQEDNHPAYWACP